MDNNKINYSEHFNNQIHRPDIFVRILFIVTLILFSFLIISNLVLTSYSTELLHKVSHQLAQVTTQEFTQAPTSSGTSTTSSVSVTEITENKTTIFNDKTSSSQLTDPIQSTTTIIPSTTLKDGNTSLPTTTQTSSSDTGSSSTTSTEPVQSTKSTTGSDMNTTLTETTMVSVPISTDVYKTTTTTTTTTATTPVGTILATEVLKEVNFGNIEYYCTMNCNSPQIIKAKVNFSISSSNPSNYRVYEVLLLKSPIGPNGKESLINQNYKVAKQKAAYLGILDMYGGAKDQVKIQPQWSISIPPCTSEIIDPSYKKCP